MLNEERKIRLQIAWEIIQRVHSDICNDTESSQDICYELCDISIQLMHFIERMKKT